MQCKAYCLGDNFDTSKLIEFLHNKDCKVQKFDNDNVIYIAFNAEKYMKMQDNLKQNDTKEKEITDVFYFKFGCIVIFEAKDSESEIRNFLNESLSYISTEANFNSMEILRDLDYLNYKVDPSISKDFIDINNNEVIVKENITPIKLSIAYGLAQSVKLDALERSCNSLITKIMPIQKELALTGKVSLSRQSMTKSMGELFAQKYLVNLYSEVLETPEFFWRKGSKYEDLYLIVSNFQELNTRKQIINKKLNILQELYEVLATEMNHSSSNRLELIIVVLITIEVAIALISHIDIKSFF